MRFFETIFLEEADKFMATLDLKSQKKIMFNIRVAEQTNDPELFKQHSLSEMEDKYIGKIGTKERDEYEYELRMELLGRMIKATRKEQNLTQEELGELVGVKKSQISKLENHTNSATIETILKVFKALKAEIQFNVKVENKHIQLA